MFWDSICAQTHRCTLDVSDMDSVSKALKSKGVNFVQEPDVQPWGTFAIIEDSEGNNLLLVQQAAG